MEPGPLLPDDDRADIECSGCFDNPVDRIGQQYFDAFAR
jgi:hypothetical protein